MWYSVSKMGLEELRTIGLALAPFGGLAAFVGLGHYLMLKLIDREKPKITWTQYFASLDETDPWLRRN